MKEFGHESIIDEIGNPKSKNRRRTTNCWATKPWEIRPKSGARDQSFRKGSKDVANLIGYFVKWIPQWQMPYSSNAGTSGKVFGESRRFSVCAKMLGQISPSHGGCSCCPQMIDAAVSTGRKGSVELWGRIFFPHNESALRGKNFSFPHTGEALRQPFWCPMLVREIPPNSSPPLI